MKTKILLIVLVFFFSCAKKKESTANQVIESDKEEITESYSSFQFNDSLSNDVFFLQDNINKEFEINNFLVTYYKYNKDDSSCFLYCIPYNKESNTFSTPWTAEINKVCLLDGIQMKSVLKENSQDYLIYLANPKDLKKLKMFKSNEEYISAVSDDSETINYTDLVNIRGEFYGTEEHYFVFKNAEIIN